MRPSEVVDFPRRDPITKLPIGRVRLQVLNLAEHDEARIRAQSWIVDKKRLSKDQLDAPGMREILGDRIAKELISMACLSVDPIKDTAETGKPRYLRHFRSADDVDILMSDELEALWMTYQMVQRKFGPYEGNLETAEQTNAWIRRLVEGGSALPLGALGWHHLVELTTLLSERAYALSAILATLSSSLPSGLLARLNSWDIGTSSYGVLPASAIEVGLQSSDLGIDEEQRQQAQELMDKMMEAHIAASAPVLPDRPITTAEAADAFKSLFKDGG